VKLARKCHRAPKRLRQQAGSHKSVTPTPTCRSELAREGWQQAKTSRASSLLQKTKRPEPLSLVTRQRCFSEASLFDRLPPLIRLTPVPMLLVLPDALMQARHAVGVVEQSPARRFGSPLWPGGENFTQALLAQDFRNRYHLGVPRARHGADQRVVRRIHRRRDEP